MNDERQEKLRKRKVLKVKTRNMRNHRNNNEEPDVVEKILEDGSSNDSDEVKRSNSVLACSQDVSSQQHSKNKMQLYSVSDETVDDKIRDIEEKE